MTSWEEVHDAYLKAADSHAQLGLSLARQIIDHGLQPDDMQVATFRQSAIVVDALGALQDDTPRPAGMVL